MLSSSSLVLNMPNSGTVFTLFASTVLDVSWDDTQGLAVLAQVNDFLHAVEPR